MNPDAIRQHCFNHAAREAVAVCLECGRAYCRECVTEHEDRVICAECLRKQEAAEAPGRRLGMIVLALQWAVALFVVWLAFYGLGQGLASLPNEFHEDVLWRSGLWAEEE